jgi:RNA polymerase sigma-70 factor, ECF subfamily
MRLRRSVVRTRNDVSRARATSSLIGTSARFTRKASPDDGNDTSGMVARAVARAREGDRDAMRYLYIRFSPNVYGYVLSIVRREHEAEDVTQQVFAKLIHAITKYEQRDVPFSAWILRVAHNMAIDHVRQRRQTPVAEVRGADERADDTGKERARMLKAALEQIPPDQREVLVLRHVLGLTPGEIAERLGKSEGSIHGLHHRGRGTLQAALRELGSAPVTATA